MAPLGTAITEMQIKSMLKYVKKLTFCFDGDKAGQKASWRACEILAKVIDSNIDAKFVNLPEGQDPATLLEIGGKVEMIKIMSKGLIFEQYVEQQLSQDHDFSTAKSRATYLNAVSEFCKNITDEVFRVELEKQLVKVCTNEEQTQTTISKKNTKTINNNNIQASQYLLALLIKNPKFESKMDKSIFDKHDETENHILTIIEKIRSKNHYTAAQIWEDIRENDNLKRVLTHVNNNITEHMNEEMTIVKFLSQIIEMKINQTLKQTKELSQEDRLFVQKLVTYKQKLKFKRQINKEVD